MQHGRKASVIITERKIIMHIAAAIFFVPGTTESRKKSGTTASIVVHPAAVSGAYICPTLCKNSSFVELVSAASLMISAGSEIRPSAIDMPAIVWQFSVKPKSCNVPIVHTLSVINNSKIKKPIEIDL